MTWADADARELLAADTTRNPTIHRFYNHAACQACGREYPLPEPQEDVLVRETFLPGARVASGAQALLQSLPKVLPVTARVSKAPTLYAAPRSVLVKCSDQIRCCVHAAQSKSRFVELSYRGVGFLSRCQSPHAPAMRSPTHMRGVRASHGGPCVLAGGWPKPGCLEGGGRRGSEGRQRCCFLP